MTSNATPTAHSVKKKPVTLLCSFKEHLQAPEPQMCGPRIPSWWKRLHAGYAKQV